ncbi:hypothetical protein [Microlunatus sp. GCM10028923]|uniref:hypothetical protein n=1 Tax=Microlunatus sp. GCM10028923 TaxID=3273400 RepID=UPI00360FD00D
MSANPIPQDQQRNPYLAAAPAQQRTDLRRVLIRMFLVTVPGQLAGSMIGGLVAQATGSFAFSFGGLLVRGAAAVLAGILIGLATTPPRRQQVVCAILAVVLGAAVAAAVMTVAVVRLQGGYAPGPLEVVPGVAVTAFGQGLVAWLCWRLKAGSAR